MSDDAILVMDQGSHASRAVLYDRRGRVITSAISEVALSRPAPGHVEQDGTEILAATRVVIAEVMAAAGGRPVRAAGLAVQRSSVIAWDRESGEPLSPVLSWQDTRAAERLEPLASDEAEIAARTGLRLSPHYGASKLAWCLDNNPDLGRARSEGRLAMGPLAAFLIAKLCGGLPHLVDHANASRTLLWHIRHRDWDPWLLDRFGLPGDILPASCPVLHEYGALAGCGVPLIAVSGDQNAALFAEGPLKQGVARVNLGTGAFVLAPVGESPVLSDSLLAGIAVSDSAGAGYLIEGTVNSAGAALAWARERWELCDLDEAFGDDSLPVPLFLNAVGGIGSPFWRHDLTPCFPETDPASLSPRQITRAVAESVLFLIMANLDAMLEAGIAIDSLALSGGLSRSSALCQALADLARLPLTRTGDVEASARGMAWLAAGRPPEWPDSMESHRFSPRHRPELSDRFEAFLAMLAKQG